MRNQRTLAFALILVFALSWAVPATASEADSESAATVQLTKTAGEVTVTKSNDKPVSIRAGMRLYDGYNVITDQASYAWINLDNSKLIKMDASSSVEIRKKDKLLEVNVKSGSAFF